MGQKVNPVGIRLGSGLPQECRSRWYADTKDFAGLLEKDSKVRNFLEKKLKGAAINKILIERAAQNNAKITIQSARPGVIIGKKGGEIEALRAEASKLMKIPVHITIEEIRKPELEAKLVAENVAQQIEKRIMYRRAMKRAVQSSLRQGAIGVKICISGRLAGSEIARTEWHREGRVPLHTFRADIDYGTAIANTTYGIIGIKVWIYRGEVQPQKEADAETTGTEFSSEE
jgi:small subunit ribosomal protein S3